MDGNGWRHGHDSFYGHADEWRDEPSAEVWLEPYRYNPRSRSQGLIADEGGRSKNINHPELKRGARASVSELPGLVESDGSSDGSDSRSTSPSNGFARVASREPSFRGAKRTPSYQSSFCDRSSDEYRCHRIEEEYSYSDRTPSREPSTRGFARMPSRPPSSCEDSDDESWTNQHQNNRWRQEHRPSGDIGQGYSQDISHCDSYYQKKPPSRENDDYHKVSATRPGAYAHIAAGADRRGEKTHCQTIQVSPGVYLRLRGADETWKAIQRDFYVPCECMVCALTILCILDANFVLCPICKSASPVVDGDMQTADQHDGGVGLGFTFEDLTGWLQEMG
jgi:hypothetical protein